MTLNAFDEWSFLEEDARRLGVDPLPVRRQTRTVNGETISYLIWGEGPPEFIYLHGGGLHAHSWDSTILALGRSALAIDLPGHGDSDWRESFDYSPESNARPIVEVIRAHIVSPITLIGQSLGGLTSIAVTAQLGELVRRLVVVDISPTRISNVGTNQVRDFIAGPESYASVDEVIDRALEMGMGRTREDLRRGVLLNTRTRPDGRVAFKHHLAHPPEGRRLDYDSSVLWPVLEQLTIPALLVYGTRGILDPERVSEFVARTPGSASLELPTGHNVQRDEPAQLADAIRDFSV